MWLAQMGVASDQRVLCAMYASDYTLLIGEKVYSFLIEIHGYRLIWPYQTHWHREMHAPKQAVWFPQQVTKAGCLAGILRWFRQTLINRGFGGRRIVATGHDGESR